MRDLRENLPIKVTALFMAVLLVLTAAGSIAAIAVGYYAWDEDDTFEGTAMFQGMAQNVAYNIAYRYARFGDPYQSYSNRGLDVVIRSGGTVYFDDLDPACDTYAYVGTYLFQVDSLLGPEAEPDPTRPFQLAVELHITDYNDVAVNNFSDYYRFYRLVHPLTNLLPYIAILSVLLFFADLVFLLCAAGHRKGHEGIVPNWQDRIPLDVYLFGAVLYFAIVISTVDGLPSNLWLTVLAMAVIIIVITVGVLAVLLSLATRLKLGRIWENTLTCRLWRWFIRCCRAFWRGVKTMVRILPFTWRTVLFTIAVLGTQIFLNSWGVWDGFPLLMLIVLDFAIVVAAALLSWQLQKLKAMGQRLADGDLEAKLDTSRMFYDIKTHAENLNAIGLGMNRAVEQRMKSERLKTELITNVSHDIKTPLTSIVNYVDLLKKEDLPEQAAEYVTVLDRQSGRLKKLTEDLVEASKASTGNIPVALQPIVVNEIIHQAVGDYDQRLTAGKIEVIINTFEGSLSAMADGRLLWRVLDNLLSNVCKYAMPGSRLYIDLTTQGSRVALSMKNISRDALNVSADELMERFVRGDSSRHAEGSGLGLNIAKSLMELMGGTFGIAVDGDLFKAELTLPLA